MRGLDVCSVTTYASGPHLVLISTRIRRLMRLTTGRLDNISVPEVGPEKIDGIRVASDRVRISKDDTSGAHRQ